jgi:SRSO17 transposase
MNLESTQDSAFRFAAFVGEIASVIGHIDRERPLNDYCAGVLVCEGRRSVEPIAAVTAPQEVPAQHQRLLHFVANAPAPTSRAQLNRYVLRHNLRRVFLSESVCAQ